MTRKEIMTAFPQASESFIEANIDTKPCFGLEKPVAGRTAQKKVLSEEFSPAINANDNCHKVSKGNILQIIVSGQVRGGKNNMIVLRSGIHIPKKEWAKWRDQKVAEVKGQLPKGWTPIDQPVSFHLKYIAGDKRRRDLPAILDSLYHVLEKAGVVADDTFLWMTSSSRDYNKETPRAELIIHLP